MGDVATGVQAVSDFGSALGAMDATYSDAPNTFQTNLGMATQAV